MKLEAITVDVRPRSEWESADLGCLLARKHFGAIARAWFMVVLPVALTLTFLLRESPYVALTLIWWLKPLYERIPVLYFGEVIFGAKPTTGALLKKWFKTLGRRLFSDLVTYRLSPKRSLWLPVEHLEGLSGSAARSRMTTLARAGDSHSFILMKLCVIFELVVALSLIIVLFSALPDKMHPDWEVILEKLENLPRSWAYTFIGIYVVAMSVVDIFFVGASFTLYLNCRTLLEGWDIELVFRKLVNRLQGAAKSVLLLCVFWVVLPGELPAEQLAEYSAEPAEVIEAVLEHPDFEVHTQTMLQPKERTFRPRRGSTNLFGPFIEVIAWVVLIGAAAYGIFYLIRHSALFRFSFGTEAEADEVGKTRTLLGMDIAPNTLPEDIIAAARKEYLAGNRQQALNLLYRGALSWMVHTAELSIGNHFTECDCLRSARKLPQASMFDYFAKLTDIRIRFIYGHMDPDAADVQHLWDFWPFTAHSKRDD